MNSLVSRAGFVALASLAFVASAAAQLYPYPSTSPVMCNVRGCMPEGVPTFPLTDPVIKHRGRFIDSTDVRYFQSPVRTYRAERVAIVPENDRIYMRIGSTFASYRLSTFFASDLDAPMVSLAVSGTRNPSEKYLPFLASVYPEKDKANWVTVFADGQDRLGENFDWDDRGYVYLPYTIYGWGIVKDVGPLQFVKQYGGPIDGPGRLNPDGILVVKDAGKYFALVFNRADTMVFDVTDPSDAKFVREIPLGDIRTYAKAFLNGKQITAITDALGNLRIYSAQALLTGAQPEKVVKPGAKSKFGSVTSDGEKFWALEGSFTSPGRILELAPTASTAESFAGTSFAVPGSTELDPRRISYSQGTLTTVGISFAGQQVHLFRLGAGIPKWVDLGPFFQKYYSGGRDAAGNAIYAAPNNCSYSNTGVLYKTGGKEYLVFSIGGLGDVYEIRAEDGIGIELKSSGWGNANPYSAGEGGPFYGDVVSFTTSATGAAVAIGVDFGNPEAGTANTVTSETGKPLSYRYSGLDSEAEILQQRTVKITGVADASKTATTKVSMLVPEPRIGILGDPSLLFTQPNASATTPLLVGQSFVDASDGSVESHRSVWTLDSADTTLLPDEPFGVGQCSAEPHTLTLTTRYGNYGTSDFGPAVSNLRYEVRPFLSDIAVNSSSASGVVFKPLTRIGAGAVTGTTSAGATFTWELLDANDLPVRAPQVTTGVLGDKPTFTVAQSELTGNKVRLTVALADLAAIPATTGCQLESFKSSIDTVLLQVPDPTLSIPADECLNVGSPCSVVASSSSGQDRTQWAYTWYLNDQKKTEASGTGPSFATYTPAAGDVSLTGTYSVRVEVVNEAGISKASTPASFTLEPAVCSGKPADISISYSGCSGTCDATDTIKFSARAWTAPFQECDQFLWKFGDGKTSTERGPSHKYTANGKYTVTLTVTNSAPGANPAPVTLSLTLGTTNPDPDPDPSPPCSAPSSNVGFAFTAAGSGCSDRTGSPACNAGETISFKAVNFPATKFQTCDRFAWEFGDGSTSTSQTPTKKYATAGTYTVTLRVHNTSGSQTATDTVTVTGSNQEPTDPECGAPNSLSYMTYRGLSSGCTESNGRPCNPDETVRLTATAWQSSFQACDRFDWSFDDGSPAATNQTSKTIDHVFAGAKLQYAVSLTVKNAAGTVTATETIEFAGEPIEKPTSVDFSVSSSLPIIGKEVTFTATANAPAAHPVTKWEWDFGDGVKKNGNPVKHTFSTEGTWNVTLRASNDGGEAAPVTKQIKVLEANAFAYLLPVVSHLSGANGSQWRTDLQIYNSNVGEGDVELEFELTNAGIRKSFTLKTSTLIYEDFMSFFTDAETAGPVIVRGAAAHDLQIWTRTYSVGASGIGTFGHLIPAVRIDGDQSFTAGETILYMTGVNRTPSYRTNIYLLNITPQSMPVTITAYEGQYGAAVGQYAKDVAPFQLTQISATEIPGTPTDKPFSVAIKGTSDGFIAYESVVDNGSNDPHYIPAIATADLGEAAMRNQVIPSVGHFGTWRSDLTVFNPDDQAIQFDLVFYDGTGALVAEAKDKILPAKGLLQLDDILRSDAMMIPTDVIGTLRVNVDSPLADHFLVVAQRNYSNAGDGKRFGQGILGFAAAEPNVAPGKPAILPAVRSDQLYKSNVGLVNVGTTDASIQLTLLDQSTGQPIGMYSLTLKPNESRIIPEAIPNPGVFNSTADRGSIKVEVTNDAAVWAFAAIIDRATSDPEYVPAIQLD